MTADAHFYAEIQQGTEQLKRQIGLNPTYFNRMVTDHGPVEATRRLVMARRLRSLDRLEHERVAKAIDRAQRPELELGHSIGLP
jgi:hypothetical protein